MTRNTNMVLLAASSNGRKCRHPHKYRCM